MKIHQVTDLHIPDDDAGPQFDHVRPNIVKMLSFVESDTSDLLVITGDLTMDDGSRSACEWLNSVIPDDLNTIVVPGNHDDPSVLWEVFGQASCMNPEFCFREQHESHTVLCVNSHTDRLAKDQIEFIRSEASEGPAILFIHHPPDLISKGFMALNQPLLNHQEVAMAIQESMVTDVFCGHYHNAVDIECNGFRLHLTPSPAFQISLQSETFEMESFDPTIRVIELSEATVETYLRTV